MTAWRGIRKAPAKRLHRRIQRVATDADIGVNARSLQDDAADEDQMPKFMDKDEALPVPSPGQWRPTTISGTPSTVPAKLSNVPWSSASVPMTGILLDSRVSIKPGMGLAPSDQAWRSPSARASRPVLPRGSCRSDHAALRTLRSANQGRDSIIPANARPGPGHHHGRDPTGVSAWPPSCGTRPR